MQHMMGQYSTDGRTIKHMTRCFENQLHDKHGFDLEDRFVQLKQVAV